MYFLGVLTSILNVYFGYIDSVEIKKKVHEIINFLFAQESHLHLV